MIHSCSFTSPKDLDNENHRPTPLTMFGGAEVLARRGPPHPGVLAAGTGGEQGQRNQLSCYQHSRTAPRKRNGPSQSCTQNILPPSAPSGAVAPPGLGGPGFASPVLGCPRPSHTPWEVLGRAGDTATSLSWDPHHKETLGALSRVSPSWGFCMELQCTHPVPALRPGWLMHTNMPVRVQCPSVPTPDSASPHCTPSLPPSLRGHRSLHGQGDTASPQCLVLPSPPTTLHLLSRLHSGQGSPCPGEATRDTQLSCVRWGVAGVAALGCGGCGRVAVRS